MQTMPPPGALVLVPTPLDFGIEPAASDLADVLPLGVIRRAARLEFWVAENAKTLRAFLKRVSAIEPLGQPLQAIQIVELPRAAKGGSASLPSAATAAVWSDLLAPARSGHDLGLAAEAGLPSVADPGAALVAAAHAANIEVVALPGSSSLLLALAASGLEGQRFAFVGYLPTDAAQRTARIRELESASRKAAQTQLMIETPYRNPALLAALLASLHGSTRLAISCGLTAAGGWTRSASIDEWKALPASIPADRPAVFLLFAR